MACINRPPLAPTRGYPSWHQWRLGCPRPSPCNPWRHHAASNNTEGGNAVSRQDRADLTVGLLVGQTHILCRSTHCQVAYICQWRIQRGGGVRGFNNPPPSEVFFLVACQYIMKIPRTWTLTPPPPRRIPAQTPPPRRIPRSAPVSHGEINEIGTLKHSGVKLGCIALSLVRVTNYREYHDLAIRTALSISCVWDPICVLGVCVWGGHIVTRTGSK